MNRNLVLCVLFAPNATPSSSCGLIYLDTRLSLLPSHLQSLFFPYMLIQRHQAALGKLTLVWKTFVRAWRGKGSSEVKIRLNKNKGVCTDEYIENLVRYIFGVGERNLNVERY